METLYLAPNALNDGQTTEGMLGFPSASEGSGLPLPAGEGGGMY